MSHTQDRTIKSEKINLAYRLWNGSTFSETNDDLLPLESRDVHVSR